MPIDLIAIVATLMGGYPVYKEAVHSLRRKRISMEVSMTLAIAATLAIGELTAAVVVAFFVILAEFIETYAADKARETMIRLEKALPKKALVRKDGREVEVDPQTLTVGDIVIVREGERIAVDGIVGKGLGFVNQATITGEAIPLEKNVGDKVYTGSVNESGLLEVRTERVGSETVFGQIIKLVQESEGKKAPIQKISDKLAMWLVEFAIGASVLTFVLTRDIISAISVIVVAGSCGVAAGTPLAIVAAMGSAAKKGVIVKGGIYVEEMSRIDTIVIDKTGTLTFGEPIVADLLCSNGCVEHQLIQYAAIAEMRSNHPIARAIIGKAAEQGIQLDEPSAFRYLAGLGAVSGYNGQQILVGNSLLMTDNKIDIPPEVREAILHKTSEGKTTVLVAYGKAICGVIAISDRIREEARRAIAGLKRFGIRMVMLTGDNKLAAKAIANEVGIDEAYAELLPHEKVDVIERLVANGHRVAMVGDGINDAPALARANVGIGMGGGTDVAIEEADIVLMTNNLMKISDMVRLSKRAYRTIMQNFYGTVLIDGVGIVLAFFGFLNPLAAATIHVASEFVFILNSARLMR